MRENTTLNTIRVPYTIREATWRGNRAALIAIRDNVFIREQNVPPALEWDGLDEACRHVIASTTAGDAIGCGRVLSDGRIGRMAVLNAWRGAGVGSALLHTLIDIARRSGQRECRLAAQITAMGFYTKHGFIVISDEFLDAGILHQDMLLEL